MDKLDFAKRLPAVEKAGRHGKSPLEKAKEKFVHEIGLQISLAKDSNSSEKMFGKRGKLKGKPINLGGRKGSHIKVPANGVADTLKVVKAAVESGEIDEVIQKAMDAAKRGKRM